MKALAGLCLFVTLGAAAPAAAADGDLLRLLHGRWEGPGLAIAIDTERLQGKTDPEHPFRWEPLTILNVTGNMVVFRIGQQDFIGLVDAEKLTLTTPALTGSRVLLKQD